MSRVRLTALCLAVFAIIVKAFEVDPARPLPARLTAYLAVAALIGCLLITHLRQRNSAGDWVVTWCTIMVIGHSLREPMSAASLCTAVVVVQLLYGTLSAAVLRSVTTYTALPALIVLAELTDGRTTSMRLMAVIGLVPSMVMAATVVRSLYGLLERHSQATQREALLARTGNQLIDATDLAVLSSIVRTTAVSLCELSPGVGLLVLRRDGQTLLVVGQSGFDGRIVGSALPAAPAAPVRGTGPAPSPETDSALPCRPRRLDELVGAHRHWRAVGLSATIGFDFFVVGCARCVTEEVFDPFRALATQHALAAARCVTHSELVFLAHHDYLTGLDNRRRFLDRLSAMRAAGQLGAVLVLDLHNFKMINDIHGHDAGDRILIATADLLRGSGEHRTIARLDADEFAVAVATATDAGLLAERLSNGLKDPAAVPYGPGASIGIAVEDPDLSDRDLLRRADTALHAAKSAGRGHIERFDLGRHGDVTELRLLEQHLPTAAERGEIAVYYQPHIELRTGRCVGLEALARWKHPTLGMVPPGRFIPLAERTGHIAGIGSHVLRVACRQAAAWTELPGCADLKVAVNVAAPQLHNTAFVDLVADALSSTGLRAGRLTLELTESGVIDHEHAREQINALAELGVRISVDDFGTGYASLATLHTITAHQVKIDRGFVSGPDQARGGRMVRLIVAAGSILDLEVVAEGVETEQQAAELLAAGVPLAQGYLYAKPMPAAEFPDWLARCNRAAGASASTGWQRGWHEAAHG